MNTIKLVIGDPSGDGHGKSEDIYIETEFTKLDIEKAFAQGAKYLKFDITKSCEDYEESVISFKDAELIQEKLSYKIEDLSLREVGDPEDDLVCLDSDEFVDIYLLTAKLGNPNFEYKIVKTSYENEIHIGGYGLFY